MRGVWLASLFFAVVLLGGCASSGSAHVTVKNEHEKELLVWVFRRDPERKDFRWTSLGKVVGKSTSDFDLPLSDLGPGLNLRLQPGGGLVKMAEISEKAVPSSGCGGARSTTLTFHSDETLTKD